MLHINYCYLFFLWHKMYNNIFVFMLFRFETWVMDWISGTLLNMVELQIRSKCCSILEFEDMIWYFFCYLLLSFFRVTFEWWESREINMDRCILPIWKYTWNPQRVDSWPANFITSNQAGDKVGIIFNLVCYHWFNFLVFYVYATYIQNDDVC